MPLFLPIPIMYVRLESISHLSLMLWTAPPTKSQHPGPPPSIPTHWPFPHKAPCLCPMPCSSHQPSLLFHHQKAREDGSNCLWVQGHSLPRMLTASPGASEAAAAISQMGHDLDQAPITGPRLCLAHPLASDSPRTTQPSGSQHLWFLMGPRAAWSRGLSTCLQELAAGKESWPGAALGWAVLLDRGSPCRGPWGHQLHQRHGRELPETGATVRKTSESKATGPGRSSEDQGPEPPAEPSVQEATAGCFQLRGAAPGESSTPVGSEGLSGGARWRGLA